jgi:hypothetical protein
LGDLRCGVPHQGRYPALHLFFTLAAHNLAEGFEAFFDAPGDGDGANAEAFGGFLLGQVVEEDKFQDLLGQLFEVDEGLLEPNLVFLGQLEAAVLRIGHQLHQGGGAVIAVGGDGRIEAEHGAILEGGFDFLPFAGAEVEGLGHFAVGGGAAQLLVQLAHLFDGLALERLPTAGHADGGAFVAEVMLDFASDVGNGEGTEGNALGQIKPLDRPNQPNTADLDQILVALVALVHPMVGFAPQEAEVEFDQFVAQPGGGCGLVVAQQL